VLGGDDGAGIVAALEIVRRVREEQIKHGNILIIFTIAEETGLLGAKHLNHEIVKAAAGAGAGVVASMGAGACTGVATGMGTNSGATTGMGASAGAFSGAGVSADVAVGAGAGAGELPRFCFVFDSGGPQGSVVSSAPSHYDIKITIKGVAAHAGIEPEKGINAIVVASEAIAAMPLGRIDDETTANVGIIHGGFARNIVCESVYIACEARSHNKEKLAIQVSKMRECAEAACRRHGAELAFEDTLEYESFSLSPDDRIIKLLDRAAKARGFELSLIATGGGSDANVLNSIGVPAANLPVGMHAVHGTSEYADLRETAETVELVVEAFRALATGDF